MIEHSWRVSRPSAKPPGGPRLSAPPGLRGVTDVVLAYRSAAIFADPDETDLNVLESRLGVAGSRTGSRDRGPARGDSCPLRRPGP